MTVLYSPKKKSMTENLVKERMLTVFISTLTLLVAWFWKDAFDRLILAYYGDSLWYSFAVAGVFTVLLLGLGYKLFKSLEKDYDREGFVYKHKKTGKALPESY